MKPRSFGNAPAGLLLFLTAYAGCLAFLLPKLSLWVDEILTVIGALQPDLPSLFSYLRSFPGGTPLAFLVPGWIIHLVGYSVFAARAYSAIFSVTACVAIFLLARRLELRAPLLAVLVFALCPLQFRYAMEARPYSMALCLSAWSTVIFFNLRDNPRSPLQTLLYGILTITGAFTIVFTLFVPAVHAIWALRRESRRLLAICIISIAAGALALVPWYAYVRQGWNGVIGSLKLGSVFNWQSASVILHELTGMGYAGTLLLLAVAGWGAFRLARLRNFWIGYALLPIIFVMLGDFAFHFFVAVRQMIYVLAPLTLLFAAGTESMGRWGKLVAVAFLAFAIYEDVKWVSKPREDWQAAAAVAADQQQQVTCLQFVPSDSELLYGFFRPELLKSKCTEDQFARADSVALVINPYSPDQARQAANDLTSRGLTETSEQNFHGPAVATYQRR
jgi:hypothetical protein